MCAYEVRSKYVRISILTMCTVYIFCYRRGVVAYLAEYVREFFDKRLKKKSWWY